MKALLLSKSLAGGAGGATYRLHQELRKLGVDSRVLVKVKEVDDDYVMRVPDKRWVRHAKNVARLAGIRDLDTLPLRLYRNRDGKKISIQWLPDAISSMVAGIAPDVVNLHWTFGGWMQIETVKHLRQPLLWTLHDMWPVTGGCHHSEECERYEESCGACPRLRSSSEGDVTRWVWKRKRNAWKNVNMTVATPSNWLANRVRASSLFRDQRVEVIPNGIDVQCFKPMEKTIVRESFGLPNEKKIILFGAWQPKNPWKGFDLLCESLGRLGDLKDSVQLVSFGLREPVLDGKIGIAHRHLGRFEDPSKLAALYAAADVFVSPSRVDNLPTTVIESLACGTPCVAFDIGGLSDMVDHNQNGYLARPYDVEDLTSGIRAVLSDSTTLTEMSVRARQKAESEFSLAVYVNRYRALLAELVDDHRRRVN